jgi:hypothetical protein
VESTYVDPSGVRICRKCRAANGKRYRQRRASAAALAAYGDCLRQLVGVACTQGDNPSAP